MDATIRPDRARSVSLEDLIASVGARLTPTERRIASSVSGDPTILAFGTVSDLAERTEASRASIVRFATKLGFAGYPQLQDWVRAGVSRELSGQRSRPSERIRHQPGALAAVRGSITGAVDHAFKTLDSDRLASLAAPIARARRVWVLSGETSVAGARVLQTGLSMVRPDVLLVGEQSVGRDLSGVGADDAAVVIDFARYRRSSVTAAKLLSGMGVPLIAITDGPLSPLASLTPMWCALRVPPVGPFDSSVPAVIAAELLVAEVVRLLGDRARQRIDRLEEVWRAASTFVEAPRSSRDT